MTDIFVCIVCAHDNVVKCLIRNLQKADEIQKEKANSVDFFTHD